MTPADTLHLGAEQAPFVMLPRWLLHSGVSDGAKVLYCMLHDLVAGREGPTRPVTRGQLAECCGVSVDTVDRRLAELIKTGAVEKQAQFETRQGQLANVYWVRLSPPAAVVRPPVDIPGTPGRGGAAPPAAAVRPPQPQPCGDPGRDGAAPIEEQDLEELLPPQPPAQRGEPTDASHQNHLRLVAEIDKLPIDAAAASAPLGDSVVGDDKPPARRPARRAAGTNPRALGTHPRAEDELAEAARQREEAERLRAAIQAEQAQRRAELAAAQAELDAAEAEALAVSGALDGERLAAVVERVRKGLAGPLPRSPLAVTQAVVAWCRGAARQHPGPFLTAVDAALASADCVPATRDEHPLHLTLPAPEDEIPNLRSRIADLLAHLTADAEMAGAAEGTR